VAPSVLDNSTARPRSRVVKVRDTITDLRILAEVRRLIASNRPDEGLAGYVRSGYGMIEHACIEPGCSCHFDVCGPFRDPPVRCVTFERVILPAFADLQRAYWANLRREPGTFKVERCRDVRCRKRCAPGSAYCEFHTGAHERSARRATRILREERALERARRQLGVGNLERLAVAGE
jgi:hypothetical protein